MGRKRAIGIRIILAAGLFPPFFTGIIDATAQTAVVTSDFAVNSISNSLGWSHALAEATEPFEFFRLGGHYLARRVSGGRNQA